MLYKGAVVALASSMLGLAACGGGGDETSPAGDTGGGPDTGSGSVATLTLGLTDAPMQSVEELVLHVESLRLRLGDGREVRLQPAGGPVSVDVAALQNGRLHDLLDRAQVPAGQYQGLVLEIDPERSHLGLADGSRHRMAFAVPEGLQVDVPFGLGAGQHRELVIDVDLGRSLYYHREGMGGHGGMADRYELHSGVRMIDAETAGGLTGRVALALTDLEQADCDSAPGGNVAYLFPGTAAEPEDLASEEADERAGPIVTDRVELHPGTGEYRYHFAFLEPGSYRVAFTCAGEWDEAADDDYPTDPDGRFAFQAFSEVVEVQAGEVTWLDINP